MINKERGVSGCVPALSLVSGEGGWQRLAALAQSQATHCNTLPRKSPSMRGTGS